MNEIKGHIRFACRVSAVLSNDEITEIYHTLQDEVPLLANDFLHKIIGQQRYLAGNRPT